jgi:hypothetical protein
MISCSRLKRVEFTRGGTCSAYERYSLPVADAASGVDAGDFMLSSGESVNGSPDVSGTSPVSDAAAGATVALAGSGAMLAGRAGAGGIVGMYKGPR